MEIFCKMYLCLNIVFNKQSSVLFIRPLCPNHCDPMNCITPGLPVHHQLPEFTQTPLLIILLLKESFVFYFGVQLIKNVAIVSGEQSNSAMHIHVFILPQTPLHPGCHIILSRIPCIIQQVHVGYTLYIQQCVHVNPKLPNFPFPSFFLHQQP